MPRVSGSLFRGSVWLSKRLSLELGSVGWISALRANMLPLIINIDKLLL